MSPTFENVSLILFVCESQRLDLALIGLICSTWPSSEAKSETFDVRWRGDRRVFIDACNRFFDVFKVPLINKVHLLLKLYLLLMSLSHQLSHTLSGCSHVHTPIEASLKVWLFLRVRVFEEFFAQLNRLFLLGFWQPPVKHALVVVHEGLFALEFEVVVRFWVSKIVMHF